MGANLTTDDLRDVSIPDKAGATSSSMTFSILKRAQALGDAQALRDENWRVIRFNLGNNVTGGLKKLTEALV